MEIIGWLLLSWVWLLVVVFIYAHFSHIRFIKRLHKENRHDTQMRR